VFEQRLRRALSVSRERLAWRVGVKQELLDFFVRQGVSVPARSSRSPARSVHRLQAVRGGLASSATARAG